MSVALYEPEESMGSMTAHWFSNAVLATISIIPAFLSIPFFRKNFGVPAEVFMVWYFFGTSCGVVLWMGLQGRAEVLIAHGRLVSFTIFLIGGAFGALANSALFRSIAQAPNPGMPPAVYSAASVVVFCLSALLAAKLPQFFNRVETAPDRLIGVLLVVLGIFLTAGGFGYMREFFPTKSHALPSSHSVHSPSQVPPR